MTTTTPDGKLACMYQVDLEKRLVFELENFRNFDVDMIYAYPSKSMYQVNRYLKIKNKYLIASVDVKMPKLIFTNSSPNFQKNENNSLDYNFKLKVTMQTKAAGQFQEETTLKISMILDNKKILPLEITEQFSAYTKSIFDFPVKRPLVFGNALSYRMSISEVTKPTYTPSYAHEFNLRPDVSLGKKYKVKDVFKVKNDEDLKHLG